MVTFRITIFFLFGLLLMAGCKGRPSQNIGGKWKVTQVKSDRKNGKPVEEINPVYRHFAVGNDVDFTEAKEINIHRPGTADDIYYGLATYKLIEEGKELVLDAGDYNPITFRLSDARDDQLEMKSKAHDVKIYLKRPEEK